MAILVYGLLNLAVLAGTSQASVLVLTGSAVTPLAAIAAAAARWHPDFAAGGLTLPRLLSDSDYAERFPDTECAQWMDPARTSAASQNHIESVALLRAGTGSYHAYRTPTTLDTGYGCLFDEESWKVTKSSREGIEEPGHFYLKLTFRF